MKKLLTLSFLLSIFTLVYAQNQEVGSCPGDSIVEVKGGVIYYPKITETKNTTDLPTVKFSIVGRTGQPLPNTSVIELSVDNGGNRGENSIINIEKKMHADSNGEIMFDVKKKDSTRINISRSGYQKVAFTLDYQLIGKDQNIVVQLFPEQYAEGGPVDVRTIFRTIPNSSTGKLTVIGPVSNLEVDSLPYEIKKRDLKRSIVAKPAIYLYPTIQTKVNIKHSFKGTVMTTYPEYANGWEVVADPSGKLKNVADNREYNYLFWDGAYRFPDPHYNYQNGFYVKKGNYTSFLLDKLTLIGLNETEVNDFIVYWLPSMNRYDEVFVHFWINDDIDNTSTLDVTPQPDTVIRVFMEFEEYKGETKLPEQTLTPNERIGFTLLEWGGSEIGSMEIK